MAVLIAGVPLAVDATTVEAAPGRLPPALVRPSVTTTPAEFWCSPGFEPRGGRCVATLSRDELFIYDTEDDGVPPPRRHRRGLRALY